MRFSIARRSWRSRRRCPRSAEPYATHQNLDLNAVYRPFTKLAITLDGQDTAVKVRRALAATMTPRMGPVHIALPSDVARLPERRDRGSRVGIVDRPARDRSRPIRMRSRASPRTSNAREAAGRRARPRSAIRANTRAGARVRRAPRRAGVRDAEGQGDAAGGSSALLSASAPASPATASSWISFGRADLIIGVGFEPVESDKLWHHTMKLVSIGPVSIAAGEYRPHAEAVGDVAHDARGASAARQFAPYAWTADELQRSAPI